MAMPIAYSVKNQIAINREPSLSFTIARTGTSTDLAQPTQVDFTTTDNSATGGTDYVSTSGQLSFGANETEKSVVVAIADAAYDNTATVQFFFLLKNAASATGSIVPVTSSSALQGYIAIPETGVVATVPTTQLIDGDTTRGKSAEQAEKAGSPTYQTIRYQTDYKNLGDADTTSTDKPFAYVRLGYARQDMNDYERIVVNTPEFHPDWLGWQSSGEPKEIGPHVGRMVPRGVDRADDPKATGSTLGDLKKYNANLNGLTLYSGSNYTVTVARHMNRVVKGDLVRHIGNHSASVVRASDSHWTYYDDELHHAVGLDKVNGQVWQYDIADAERLKISSRSKVSYALDSYLGVHALARGEARNTVGYSITNGIEHHTRGMAASINSNVVGNYNVNLPGTMHVTNHANYVAMADIQGLYFTCNPVLSATANAAVAISSAAVAAFGAGMMTPGFLSSFQSGKSFFKTANSENLGSDYASTFTTALPDTLAVLSAVNTAIVLAATVMQVMTTWWPDEAPIITANVTGEGIDVVNYGLRMQAEAVSPSNVGRQIADYVGSPLANIKLQAGMGSIKISNLGIDLLGPSVLIDCAFLDVAGLALAPVPYFGFGGLTTATVAAPSGTIAMNAPKITAGALMEIAGDVMATGVLMPNVVLL